MTEVKAKAPALPAEQAADLAALENFANDAPIIPGTPEAQAAEVAAAKVPLADELAGAVLAFVAIAGPMLPSLQKIYTQETTQAAAQSMAAVCEKNGWLQGGLMGEYAEEVTALIVCGPLAYATVQGIKADLAANREREKPAAIQPGQKPVEAPTTVSFGDPLPPVENENH